MQTTSHCATASVQGLIHGSGGRAAVMVSTMFCAGHPPPMVLSRRSVPYHCGPPRVASEELLERSYLQLLLSARMQGRLHHHTALHHTPHHTTLHHTLGTSQPEPETEGGSLWLGARCEAPQQGPGTAFGRY